MQNETGKPRYAVISLFPEMFNALTDNGVCSRAVKNGLVELSFFNPRDFTSDKHQTVDDRPYGGGPGMVMSVEPLAGALESAINWLGVDRKDVNVIYFSPQGRVLDNAKVVETSVNRHTVLIAGRYEGVDERFIEMYVDEELSIGDYVLSGGELPAMVLLDALFRRIPGVLGHKSSAEEDSFENGLLDYPHYTRPEVVDGKEVPSVLLSGDHKKIAQWRYEQSLVRTAKRRPDLIERVVLDEAQQAYLKDKF